jgi:hypothetical protein
MGIIIRSSVAEHPLSRPFPLPVAVDLECDEASEFFCRGIETFTSEEGFVGAHAAAMKAGWLERNGPNGRMWLCPRCSGKNG